MARNRMIQVEFWDDEKLATIPRDARLLFIGLWNYSDDYGVVKGHSLWLKSKIFPYDDIAISTFNEWLQELQNIDAIQPYIAHGEQYFFIRTFTDHQVISKPSKKRNPPPVKLTTPELLPEGSITTPGRVQDEKKLNRNGNRNRKEDNTPTGAVAPLTSAPKKCQHEKIIDLYHVILPSLPGVNVWGDEKQKILRARWKSNPEYQSLDWWGDFFRYVGESKFLMGQVKDEFMADLEWLVTKSNFGKILNGRYNRNGNNLKHSGINEWLRTRQEQTRRVA